MKKVLIIIPAYNEEANILKVYNSIMDYNKKNKTNYDVIVINDCSKDRTSEICHDNSIPVVDLIHNLGIGGAVQTGYKYAYYHDYDIAVQFDGDGQHDIRYVKDIVNPIIDGKADMVIGSRFIGKKSKFKSTKARRIGIKIISSFMKLATHKKIYDVTSGFRAINKEIIYDFSLSYPNEYPEPITTAEVLKKKFKVKEVAVEMNAREGGISSIRAWKNVYYMMNVCLALLMVKIRRYKRCR
ncbi:MAG: glycosyltransferase family 2 protein [Bacilli bacterium]|nr:glycosyltransferase family 2 protein [Bacilli bacterium]